jgi:hypothetical protein
LGRLKYHYTEDEKKTGIWNAFSWFGFLPVTHEGKLGMRPTIDVTTDQAISDTEALLIWAREGGKARLTSRKRGRVFFQLRSPLSHPGVAMALANAAEADKGRISVGRSTGRCSRKALPSPSIPPACGARSTRATLEWHQCHAYVLFTPEGAER